MGKVLGYWYKIVLEDIGIGVYFICVEDIYLYGLVMGEVNMSKNVVKVVLKFLV